MKHKKELLIRPAKYAKELNVTRQTIYNWIKSGRLKHEWIDGRLFVKKPTNFF